MSAIVGVVVPLHNGEEFVERALQSILAQLGDVAFHVVCVDDGSNDGSVALINEYRKAFAGFDIIAHPIAEGPGASRNQGARFLSTEFVAFLDQDDRWEEGKTIAQLEILNGSSELQFAIGMQRFEFENEAYIPGWFRPEWMAKPQLGFVPSALMVRREFFLRSGGFSENFFFGGDDTGWFAKCIRERIRYQVLGEVLVTRFIHRDNNSQNTGAANKELLGIVREHLMRGLG
jgi:glycosyltransferase involved in cell wall biosynthesis